MLENLVIAVESEAQVVDIGRVSGFMQKASQSLYTTFVKSNLDYHRFGMALFNCERVQCISLYLYFHPGIIQVYTQLYNASHRFITIITLQPLQERKVGNYDCMYPTPGAYRRWKDPPT